MIGVFIIGFIIPQKINPDDLNFGHKHYHNYSFDHRGYKTEVFDEEDAEIIFDADKIED